MDEYTPDVYDAPEAEESAELPEAPSEGEAEAADTHAEGDIVEGSEKVDYEGIMRSDLLELKREFSELRDTDSITEIKNSLRYAALRDLGLSPTEAYLAARGKVAARSDNRSHLSHSVPRAAGAPMVGMSHSELESARELFYGMSDSEIQSLYRRVTK